MTLILSDGRTKSEQPQQQQQQQEPCLIIAGENLPQSPTAAAEEKGKGPAVAALLARKAGRQAAPACPAPALFPLVLRLVLRPAVRPRPSVQRPHAPRKAVRSGGSALNNQSNDKMAACRPPARGQSTAQDGAARGRCY